MWLISICYNLIGSGETLFASRGGAVFGYALLWCFVGGAIMKCIQVYSGARYMILTGEHPMAHWAHLPGPPKWVPLLIGVLSLLCFPFWLAGLSRILGETINWAVGMPDESPDQIAQFVQMARIWGTMALLLAAGLTLVQTYKVLENVQTTIVAMLLVALMAACVASQPDWLSALAGTLIPKIPEYQDWIVREYKSIAERPEWVEVVVYLGAIGGGTYDYIGYLGCLREKKWGALASQKSPAAEMETTNAVLKIDLGEENIQRARRWLLPAKIDASMSFLAVLIFTICFVVLGAVILHPAHKVPQGRELLTHQAGFLTAHHPSLLYFYQIGIFMAYWGTIYGAYELWTRTTYECLATLSRRLRQLPIRRVRMAVLLYCAVVGLLLLWTTSDPVKLVTPAAIVGGVLTCGLWCFAMIWVDRRHLPKPLRMGKVLLSLTTISGVVLTVLGVRALWDYIGKFL